MERRDGIPDHAELRAILSEEGAPDRITLDIGGSEDINGDGLVFASLDKSGNLVFEDA